jgi:hypothetical protein
LQPAIRLVLHPSGAHQPHRVERRHEVFLDALIVGNVSLFHRMLQIDPRELRYDRPDNQPKKASGSSLGAVVTASS